MAPPVVRQAWSDRVTQINDVTGYQPKDKLRYDVEYIRRQSFWYDLKIVVCQVWLVVDDIVELLD